MKQITIGADPEFVLNLKGDNLDANHFIRDEYCTKRFGVDGGGQALEVRPKQNKDPLKVVYNIQKLLEEGYETLNDINVKFAEWRAGGCKEIPIGGHIHFSGLPFKVTESFVEYYADNEDNIDEYEFDNQRQIEAYKKYAKLICALNTYLAQIVILLEDPGEAFSRHRRHGYGALGDVREERWGFEYRTLGSWLTSPSVAAGVLCLAKVVAHEAVFNSMKIHNDIKPSRDAFFSIKYSFHRRKFKRLWTRIKRMQLYPKYKKYINFLKRLILSRKIWNQKKDMKILWGIIPTKPSRSNIKRGDKVFILHDGLWERKTVTSVIGKHFYVSNMRLHTSQYWTKWRLK